MSLLLSFFVNANSQINELKVGVLVQSPEIPSAVPDYLKPNEGEGLAGALQAAKDSNRTGKFLGLGINLNMAQLDDQQALISQAKEWMADGVQILLVDADTQALLALRKALPEELILINTGNREDSLRTETCLANTLHTAASFSMQTDALAQWLRSRRLSEVMLVKGDSESDKKYAEAVKASLKKFGHKLVAEKSWSFDTDLRRVAGKELQAFTQGPEYDLVWVADTRNLFGQLLPYNTFLPRPVVGTHGLEAGEWSQVIEAWGAVQMQNRFFKDNQRPMTARDYNAWIAIRALSEAMTKTRSTQGAELLAAMLHPGFYIAGYKGRKLSFRPWSGQLRQPVPLFNQQALVATAPFEGFLHPRNEMDTLGADRRESRCTLASQE
ncbi:ABC transporter substrate-binding protein [Shewanella corallii]|uniref:ABC transporter substrate-binding protein n=1 Tax=Shewanella corallii TaxID=560080 RepID=A0ABT0N4L8_9GAMM|nr:ABC transporter substrate-binding protein [Shewanella corallii]MCL2912742.1 ABC transporter substrate-binding protein [Shewanella corallii]